jgi:probable HAF family extracellular repeat protein
MDSLKTLLTTARNSLFHPTSRSPRAASNGSSFQLEMESLEERASPGSILDLLTLGGFASTGLSINNFGQVSGDSLTFALSNPHAYYSPDGQNMYDMGTLGGATSRANDINDHHGHTVGQSRTASGENHAFYHTLDAIYDLGTLGGRDSMANASNTYGYTVGWAQTENGVAHAFIHYGYGMFDLGTLGGQQSVANDINDYNQVVGRSSVNISNHQHAFLWQDGAMYDLGTLGGLQSQAFAINELGQIVGQSNVSIGILGTHAFLRHSDGWMQDLGTLGGRDSFAYGINNNGLVVGASQNAKGIMHAFVYADGVMTDLNDLIPPDSGWFVLREAREINDNGQIVGTGLTADGFQHAFILDIYA